MTEETQVLESRAEVVARVPADQRFTWKMTPMPGRLLFADTVGQSLIAMKDIFKSVGQEFGQRIVVSILDAKFEEDGSLVVELVVMQKEAEKKKNATPNPAETPAKSTPYPHT